jgi:hypothetical protein
MYSAAAKQRLAATGFGFLPIYHFDFLVTVRL